MALEPVPKRTKVADPPMRQADAPVIPKIDVQGPESAEPTNEKRPERERTCALCKKVQVMLPVTRCKPCNTLYNRVLNTKYLMGRGSIGVWDDMEKEKRNEFIMSAQDLKGKALKAKLQTYLSQELESKVTISVIGTGEFKDSPDLQKKYRDKPEQLKNLKESTRTFVCPNRKCTLYEDMAYRAVFTDEQTLTEKRRMDHESEEPIRAPKNRR